MLVYIILDLSQNNEETKTFKYFGVCWARSTSSVNFQSPSLDTCVSLAVVATVFTHAGGKTTAKISYFVSRMTTWTSVGESNQYLERVRIGWASPQHFPKKIFSSSVLRIGRPVFTGRSIARR